MTASKTPPRPILTPRELQITRLIADNLTNKQIATRLLLSERTVETHITNILNKLRLNSRIQITRWAADATVPGPSITDLSHQ